jgi:hypothetical protein
MLFARGRRLFSIASIATIVVAILHTIGNTAPFEQPPAMVAVLDAMRGYQVPMGMGMFPTIWDIFRGLVFTMTVCLLGLGALGLVLAADPAATPRLLSRVAVVFSVTSAALTALFAFYRIAPPLISMVVVTLLYAGAVKSTRTGQQRR